VAAINERTKWIKDQLFRWTTARDVIAGTYAVRAKGELYLPKAYSAQTATEYLSYQKHVPFYPAANRTCDGIVGLMMRRDPVLEASGLLSQIKGIISSNGDSVEELARKVCREVLITNYCGLLTDYPSEKASSLGAMLDEGKRPFVNIYTADNILECTPGIVKGTKKPVRVRLLEDENTVLLFEIDEDGFVVSKLYKAKDKVFPVESKPTKVFYPEANGQRLTEIPFDLVTTGDSYEPTEAPLDNVVTLNLDHFISQSMISKQLLFTISPMLFVTGVEGGGDDIAWIPAAIYKLPDANSKVYVASVPSDAAVPLEHQMASLEDKMAAVASRILARQKSVAEAAETEAVRQGAENSVLAMIANSVGSKMEKALARVNLYNGDDTEVRFQINTDYLVVNLSSQELIALLAMRQAGELSEESFFYKCREGNVYDETLTYEQERARRAAVAPQQVSRPSVTELPSSSPSDSQG
jgi:hypothetical protein